MNDADLKNLEQQLERATASGGPSDAPLDEDTQALRETWLSLANLLETTQPTIDKPFELQLRRVRPNRRRLAGLVVLAASLLVAVILGWHLLNSGGTSTPNSAANGWTKNPKSPSRPAPRPRQVMPARAGSQVRKVRESCAFMNALPGTGCRVSNHPRLGPPCSPGQREPEIVSA